MGFMVRALKILAITTLAALGLLQAAHASAVKPLPTAVKRTRVRHAKSKHRHEARNKRKARGLATPSRGRGSAAPSEAHAIAANEFAPSLREEAQAAPFAAKYFSRTVYYVRSSAPLPADYDCNAEKQAEKIAEAQTQAQEKCSASGKGDCRMAGSVIAKRGVLQCGDFPGHRCPGKGHYRGCVAEALVLGE